MFRIRDRRPFFYQWDINQKVVVNCNAHQVHFCNGQSDSALVVEVKDGMADVPNILLQTAGKLQVYAYVCDTESPEEYTLCNAIFEIKRRSRPENYIYEETELMTFESVLKEANAAKDAAESAQAIAEEKAQEAADSEAAAKQSETNAAKSASDADSDAVAAGNSADSAARSASSASDSASSASSSASAAASSASKAAQSEKNAADSATNAGAAKDNAETARENAERAADDAAASADNAAQSESNAKASEDAAAVSAKQAEDAAGAYDDLEARVTALEEGGGGGGGGGASLPNGGVAGDMLVKKSATNGDAEWERVTATDEEAIAVLAGIGAFPAVTSDGAILTDSEGNILLWE